MRAAGLLALALWAGAAAAAGPLWHEDFEAGLRPGWEEKRFQGRTAYEVVAEPDGNHALRAEARASASGLVYELAFDPCRYPILSWRWRVDRVVARSDPTRKEGDDYAARVYVVFPHWFPPKTKSLNYIWATRPLPGPVPNPFFSNAVMIAAEAGAGRVGRWVTVRRNLVEDFRAAFGTDPPRAGAVALMTDTDQTGEAVTAWYDDLRIEPADAPACGGD
ncbi:DUF3047 domain-containing protein [Deferrisoma palaeochoriense]